jgi:hypothetical protein
MKLKSGTRPDFLHLPVTLYSSRLITVNMNTITNIHTHTYTSLCVVMCLHIFFYLKHRLQLHYRSEYHVITKYSLISQSQYSIIRSNQVQKHFISTVLRTKNNFIPQVNTLGLYP